MLEYPLFISPFIWGCQLRVLYFGKFVKITENQSGEEQLIFVNFILLVYWRIKGIFLQAMKILIFTEGTIIMHKNGIGHSRKRIVQQVKDDDPSIHDYSSYVPIGEAVNKLIYL